MRAITTKTIANMRIPPDTRYSGAGSSDFLKTKHMGRIVNYSLLRSCPIYGTVVAMTNDGKHYLSKEKYDELVSELAILKGSKRKEIAEALEFAKSLGDLSENAEYQEARENQAALEDRISKLDMILKNAEIIKEDHHTNLIDIGSKVTVRRAGEKEDRHISIVGSEEANFIENKLSNESPIGKALLGRKKGDKVQVNTPKGKVEYTVVEVA